MRFCEKELGGGGGGGGVVRRSCQEELTQEEEEEKEKEADSFCFLHRFRVMGKMMSVDEQNSRLLKAVVISSMCNLSET